MRQPLNPLNPLFHNVENREILKVSLVIFQHCEIKGILRFQPSKLLNAFHGKKRSHFVQNQTLTILDCIGF